MKKLRLREQTADDFEKAAFVFIGHAVSQNIDRTREEVLTSIKDVHQSLSDVAPAMYDDLVSDPAFVLMAQEITKQSKETEEKQGKKSEE